MLTYTIIMFLFHLNFYFMCKSRKMHKLKIEFIQLKNLLTIEDKTEKVQQLFNYKI